MLVPEIKASCYFSLLSHFCSWYISSRSCLGLISSGCRFPCRPGDYLLLANGDFAEVLRQTVELVQLRVMGSLVLYDQENNTLAMLCGIKMDIGQTWMCIR